MRLCANCSTELSETARFCTNCGQTFTEEKTVAQTNGPAETIKAATIQDEKIEPASEQTVEAEVETIQIGLEDGLNLFTEYGYFFKNTLFQPTSIFEEKRGHWWNGGISLLLLSVGLSLSSSLQFFPALIRIVILQIALVGTLFIVSKFFLKTVDTFTDTIEVYGALLQAQILLSYLFWLIQDASDGLAFFLSAILFLNQLNILNIYLSRVESVSKFKFDTYYQLVLANAGFIVVQFILLHLLF